MSFGFAGRLKSMEKHRLRNGKNKRLKDGKKQG
jgi:hypothetical protein